MHALFDPDPTIKASAYHWGITEHAYELPEPGSPEFGRPAWPQSIEQTIDHQLANAPWLNRSLSHG